MATWFTSLAERLPLKTIPTSQQIEIAKQFTQQPELPWCRLTFSTVHSLVWAQALQAQIPADGRLAHELMAAMTWGREIIVPDPLRIMSLTREPVLPDQALSDLAGLDRQTTYLLIEQPAMGDASVFVCGAWLMYDCDLDTGQKILLLLLDLLVEGKPVRDVLMEFTVETTFEESVEKLVEKTASVQGWDAMPGAIARRDHLRAYMRSARPVLAAFYDTLVVHRADVERARAGAVPDELGFTWIDVSRQDKGAAQMAHGLYH